MDYELEYMENLFYNIKNKKTESYVIHRIWNKLDDDSVRFVTQQKISLPNGKYALADLYLPQLNIFVEVNEPYHDKQKDLDKYRNDSIVKLTEADQFIIECGKGTDKCEWKDLAEIHRQIDKWTLYESNTKDPEKNSNHIEDAIKKNLLRVTFFKYKDDLGIENYFFLGIFRIDAEASRHEKKCVWRRVSNEYKL